MDMKVLKTESPISAGLVFSGLCNIRNNETLLRLHRAHLSIALNLTGVVAALLRLASFPDSKLELGFFVVAGVVAIIFNFLWYRVVERNSQWLDYWNDKLVELERVCGMEGAVRIYTSERFSGQREGRIRFRGGWQLFTAMLMLFWGSVAAMAFIAFVA
ncbi:MAG: hypothetical protein WA021_00610 [Minisyncoccia bacterium]